MPLCARHARLPRSAVGTTDPNDPMHALEALRLRHKFDFLQLSLVFRGFAPSAGIAGTSPWGNRRSSGLVRTAGSYAAESPKTQKGRKRGEGRVRFRHKEERGALKGIRPARVVGKEGVRRPPNMRGQSRPRRHHGVCRASKARIGRGRTRPASRRANASPSQALASGRPTGLTRRPARIFGRGSRGTASAPSPDRALDARPGATSAATARRRQAAAASCRRRACYLPWAASMPALRPNVIVRPAARPVIRLG